MEFKLEISPRRNWRNSFVVNSFRSPLIAARKPHDGSLRFSAPAPKEGPTLAPEEGPTLAPKEGPTLLLPDTQHFSQAQTPRLDIVAHARRIQEGSEYFFFLPRGQIFA